MFAKKLLPILLAAALVTGAFAGCTPAEPQASESAPQTESTDSSEAGSASEEAGETAGGTPISLKIYSIVADQPDQAAVMAEVNKYTQEKLNTTVEYVNMGDKMQTVIASREEYDACFTSNWANSYTTNVAKGAYQDVKDLLPTVTPDLYKSMPEYFWTAATVNGGIYAVPNQQIVARQLGIFMPKEYVDAAKLDYSSMTKLTDYTDYIQYCKDNYGAKAAPVALPAEYCGYELINDIASAGVIKMSDSKAKVVNLFETPEWTKMLNDTAALYEKGLMDSQAGYDGEYAASQRLAKKHCVNFAGTYKPGVEGEESTACGYPVVFGKVAEAPYVTTNSIIATMFGISSTSKNPEGILKYLELVNTDPYLMNLLSFGIEGTHYTKTGENSIEAIPDSGYAGGASWAIGNVFNTYTMPGQPEDVWEQTKVLNESAATSPLLGFSFDPEPVKLQLVNMSSVYQEYASIIGGELPVEKTNQEFNEKLRNAGLDEVLTEMQKQIDAFMASK